MWWMFALALAAPPEGLDLEDPVPWEEASRQLFEGPPGCWEVVGKATWNHDGARFGVSRGEAAFAGRIQDGVWADELHIEPLGEIVREGAHDTERLVYRDEAQPFMPLLGRHTDMGDSKDPTNVVDNILAEFQGEARYSWVKWDDASGDVVYTEVVPVGDREDAPEITMDVRFPGGGKLPSRAEFTFPEKITVHPVPPIVLKSAALELRAVSAGGRVFPAAEAYSADFGVLGIKLHSAQTIQYRSIRPCASPELSATDAEQPKVQESPDQP